MCFILHLATVMAYDAIKGVGTKYGMATDNGGEEVLDFDSLNQL